MKEPNKNDYDFNEDYQSALEIYYGELESNFVNEFNDSQKYLQNKIKELEAKCKKYEFALQQIVSILSVYTFTSKDLTLAKDFIEVQNITTEALKEGE